MSAPASPNWGIILVNFLGVGSQLNELYITPSLLKPAEWDALGSSLQWAVANAHPLLDNGAWVLDDPAKREPYGYLHYSPEKTILALRNPFVRPAVANVKLVEAAGFEPSANTFQAEVAYPYRQVLPGALRYGDTLRVNLDGYDQQIIELRPIAAGEARLAGVRYSLEAAAQNEVGFKLYASDGANILAELSQPSAYETARNDGEKVELKAGGETAPLALHFGKKNARESQPAFNAPTIHATADGVVTVAINVQVPPDFRESQASLLLESAAAGLEVKAEARDNAQPVTVAVVKSPQGAWHWFTLDLAPGSHALEFDLHLPAAALNGTQLSGWLRSKRALAAKDLRLTMRSGEKLAAPPANLLPASTEVEKLTYALFEETAL